LTDVNLDGNEAGVATGAGAPGNGGGLHISGDSEVNITGGTSSNNIAANEGGGLWNGAGVMTIDGTNFNGNSASGAMAANGGGAIFNNAGTLTILNNSEFNGNLADGASGSGGALFSKLGTVTIIDAIFDGNSANRAGGAIELAAGNLDVLSSTFSNNDVDGTAGTAAPGNGGAFHITGGGGTVNFTESTFTGNAAANEGGALWNQNGVTMNVMTSTIDNNSAAEGGGIYNNSGAITTIMLSTISTNDASATGGGIQNDGASLSLNAVTVALNTATTTGGGIQSNTTTSLTNTIVASNAASAGNDVAGTFVSNDYNLIFNDDLNAFPAASNDRESVDPMLGSLQNNGGTTETHELLMGSQAYNFGNPADQFADQIGQAVFASIRDIGAFEAQLELLSIDDFGNVNAGIILYPNPTSGKFSIKIPENMIGEVTGRIVSVTGKVVKQINISSGINDVTVNDLASGMYIVNLNTPKGSVTKKLIIK